MADPYDWMLEEIGNAFRGILGEGKCNAWRLNVADVPRPEISAELNESHMRHRAVQAAVQTSREALSAFRESKSKRSCISVLSAIEFMEQTVHKRLADCMDTNHPNEGY